MKFADLRPLVEADLTTVAPVPQSDTPLLQKFADFYNQAGQLNWQLNPVRIKSKLGVTGVAYALFDSAGTVVGTIALKQAVVGPMRGAEVGYFMVAPEFRSFSNAKKLYDAIMAHAGDYEFVFSTTNTTNSTINKLSERSKEFEHIFTAESPFSSNMLHYWLSKKSNGAYTFEEQVTFFEEQYQPEHIE
jgi:hypothetical protein